MKPKIRKALTLFLVCLLLLSFSAPAFAKESLWISQSLSDIPIIRISGDGEKLVDENGDKVFHYKDALTALKSDKKEETDNTALMKTAINVLLPFLINGLLHDDEATPKSWTKF